MRTGRSNDSDVTVVAPTRGRRHRSKQERREIAEESLQPGASVAVIARSHGVNANQVFHWRKLLREGRLEAKAPSAQLMPVRITEVIEEKPRPVQQLSGVIHIELGKVRVRVEGSADPTTLRIILEQLGR
jgi:transposase